MQGMRVLVVDDNEDCREMTGLLVQSAGYDVKMAGNGIEALAIAKTFDPKAVLVDLNLPGIDGYSVARELSKSDGTSLLIATTGHTGAETARSCAAAGFHHHMVKPIDVKKLMKLLADCE
jgi:CheY-like chemotaxis protein